MNQLEKLALGLKQLALEKADARDLAPADRIVHHTLRGGLRIAVQFNAGDWSIGFWRLNSTPSPVELQTLRRDFGIPATALDSGERTRRGKAQGEIWRGYVLTWHGAKEAAQQAALIE